MPNDDTDSRTDSIYFLIERYDQITGAEIHTNEIIHETFYISIVVVGFLLGVVPQLESITARVGLYLFAVFIFIAMLMWTWTYLTSRDVLEEQKRNIIEEIRKIDNPFVEIQSVSKFLPEPEEYRREDWEQGWRKENLLLVYYLGFAILSIFIIIIELAGYYFSIVS